MKKKAYALFFGQEFHGVFPSMDRARRRYEEAVDRVGFRTSCKTFEEAQNLVGLMTIQYMCIDRARLEALKDDEVTDHEWEEFQCP